MRSDVSPASFRRGACFQRDPTLPPARTARTREVAAHFGVLAMLPTGRSCARRELSLDLPRAGELLLLEGPSGSGKSLLLRRLASGAGRAGWRVARLDGVALPARPVVDQFGDEPLDQTLRRLARVGLAEVWTWLRTPGELSDGQRWRLRLALLLADAERTPGPTLLVCDEFGALLDRVTACVAAGVLRRAVDESSGRLAAAVATSHDDLRRPLAPDVRIACDFGQYVITRARRRLKKSASATRTG